MPSHTLDQLTKWVAAANEPIRRSWDDLVFTPLRARKDASTDAGLLAVIRADGMAPFLGAAVASLTTRAADVTSYWKAVKDEFRRGMPTAAARTLLDDASRVIHTWAGPAKWVSHTISLDPSVGGNPVARAAFAAADTHVAAILAALKRMLDHLNTPFPPIDEERLAAGREAIRQGRFVTADQLRNEVVSQPN